MSYVAALEKAYIQRTLAKCKRNDLAVVDTDGCEALVKSAVSRGVYVHINQKLTALLTIRIAFDL